MEEILYSGYITKLSYMKWNLNENISKNITVNIYVEQNLNTC
jgi:hypothetical protein